MNQSQTELLVDIAVVGAGLAGHCAALAAADSGAKVLLLEKTAAPGGSTVLSAGSFAFAGTELQSEVGVNDSPDGLATELTKISGGYADPALVQLYVDHQVETFEWLRKQGVQFHKISLSSGTNVPRTHPTNARQLIDALHRKAREHPNILYLANTNAKGLVVQNGKVTGLNIAQNDRDVSVRCVKGVILTTGGFTRNRSLVEKFAPELSQAPAWGGEGNTGDGLVMAWGLGADLLDMGFVSGTFGVALNRYPDTHVHAGDDLFLRMAMYRGGIAVNLDAERFADESQSYKKLATLCLAQPQAIAFQVFDQKVMDQSVPNPSVNDLRGVEQRGIVRRADTLEELGEMLGISGVKLRATVDRYNSNVDEGRDPDFGRACLGGGYGKPVRIDTAPYYALPCSTALLSTYAGLRVNTSMEVLHVSGSPIAGLYAAGEVIGGFHGAGYMSGSSLGKAAIFGRIAGAAATRS